MFIHDLTMRAHPAGDVAELAMLKENNRALWNRIGELEGELNELRGGVRVNSPDPGPGERC